MFTQFVNIFESTLYKGLPVTCLSDLFRVRGHQVEATRGYVEVDWHASKLQVALPQNAGQGFGRWLRDRGRHVKVQQLVLVFIFSLNMECDVVLLHYRTIACHSVDQHQRCNAHVWTRSDHQKNASYHTLTLRYQVSSSHRGGAKNTLLYLNTSENELARSRAHRMLLTMCFLGVAQYPQHSGRLLCPRTTAGFIAQKSSADYSTAVQ